MGTSVALQEFEETQTHSGCARDPPQLQLPAVAACHGHAHAVGSPQDNCPPAKDAFAHQPLATISAGT